MQQLDSAVYIEMPGMRGVNVSPQPGWLYLADSMGQVEVILATWAGKLADQMQRLLLTGPSLP